MQWDGRQFFMPPQTHGNGTPSDLNGFCNLPPVATPENAAERTTDGKKTTVVPPPGVGSPKRDEVEDPKTRRHGIIH